MLLVLPVKTERPEGVTAGTVKLVLTEGAAGVGNGSLKPKSLMNKPDMYTFERQARFYEKQRGQKTDRLTIISPTPAR